MNLSTHNRRTPTLALLGICAVLMALWLMGGKAAQAQTGVVGCWTSYASPLNGAGFHEYRAVAAISSNDVWAVGFQGAQVDGKYETLTVHWDGQRWSVVPSPNAGDYQNILDGVTALSPNDVWAVGYESPLGGPARSVALHYDGKAWSLTTLPEIPGLGDGLSGVAGTGPNDVWAVGSYTVLGNPPAPTGAARRLILHWNGTAWSQSPLTEVPNPPDGWLARVIALAPDNAWAVGTGLSVSIFHWDGTAWHPVSISGATQPVALLSIAALSPTDIWAAGQQDVNSVVAHYDGTNWTLTPLPDVAGKARTLTGLSAFASNDIWATGYYYPDGPTRTAQQALALHWNGQAWTQEPSPVNTFLTLLNGTSAEKGTSKDFWSVGGISNDYSNPGSGLLLRHSNSSCAALTASPTTSATSTQSATPTTTPSSTPALPLTPAASPTPRTPLPPPLPMPGTGSQSFSQTGKTVSGLFLSYWNAHGGLPQQGYPISDVIGEVSPLNGITYTMQYFERAVFEYHPENQPPYNVLLSLLGAIQYRQKYPTGAPGQVPNNSAGSVFFPQTGHRLGGRFLQYWQQNGGVMQQGYPISDEFTEVSDLDGKPYTVQYFERAVFEIHPENKAPYDVLLSQLGVFSYKAKYASGSGQGQGPQLPIYTPVPLPSAQAGKGIITGTLGYPSEVIPRLDVYAFEIGGSRYYSVRTNSNQQDFAIGGVEPGMYYVVAYSQAAAKGDPAMAGYTQAVICGLYFNCADHTLIAVAVRAGAVSGEAAVKDYTPPPGGFPAKP